MPPFTTPDWVKESVFYQIFPDRFANGDPTRNPPNLAPWNATPTPTSFHGGDLRGIIQHLDYLHDLGIGAIYLNPIFHASSNHKYNTYNYFEIDPHFGDLATFHELIATAHARSIRVILDGVFNHCGRGFFAFHNLLENQRHSPYLNWFTVHRFPLNAYNDDETEEPPDYACWWNIRSLPRFNTDTPAVRRYLLDIARYWLQQGADGWRLDVPDEIADHDFWREFRRTVKAINPDAYIVGEIWKDARPWLDGTQFDGVMNYLLRDLCIDFFAHQSIESNEFAAGVAALLERYPREATLAQLNLLGSHDTPRFLTECGGDPARLHTALLFLLTFPGAPCLYYGDEIGMQGGKDPLCRGGFIWERTRWNQDIYHSTRNLIALRRAHPALRRGTMTTLPANAGPRVYCSARADATETLVVALNTGSRAATFDLPLPDTLPASARHAASAEDLLRSERLPMHHASIPALHLPAQSGRVLRLT